ncbi:MAG: hypothetical protein VX246_04090 [Myxococcota bacterium]|nr:hypothetical protein [Myxococcota bacterium]
MPNDFTLFLWLLKLGALANLYFLANTLALDSGRTDPQIVVPAVILFAVSGYRCLFPNRYKDNVVLHDSVLSSTLVTRVIATFSEVAYIYQFSHVLRLLNVANVGWVDALSWLMVFQVVVSQFCVWGAIATERLTLYVYEELGWLVMFVANTVASAYLYATVEGLGPREILLQLNLLFGVFYLPWQVVHLHALRTDAQQTAQTTGGGARVTPQLVASLLGRAL